MKLVATKGLTYGTRHMQAGEPFKATAMDGAVLLATGQAMTATRADKQRQELQPLVQAAASASADEPAEGPDARPRRARRRNHDTSSAD